MSELLMATYARLPVTFDSGQGAWLWDTNGKKYLDALSGIAVCGLGHAHPTVKNALCDQAGRLLHTSNLYGIAHQEELAARLTQLSGLKKVFFSNSGAEAVEAAIKIARLYGHHKNIKNPTIVVTENSFHGRTLATLSATGNRKVQAGFEPLVTGFLRVPFNDLDALTNVAKNNNGDVVAVLVEPIQGEGGINIPSDEYLPGIRDICNKNNWLMILDEVQTGLCRTGKWFAYQHYNILPDIITLAKALGNGVPTGACIAGQTAADVFQPGNHGSTLGGNPLACRVALSVLSEMEKNKLDVRAEELGNNMLDSFRHTLQDNKHVTEIRGRGLMIGIQLDQPCKEMVTQALEKGILINVTAENVIRLLPPLIISDDESNQIVDSVCQLIHSFTSSA